MPFIGLTPFLRIERKNHHPQTMAVSMPFIGLTPFLRTGHFMISSLIPCVNALHRAYSISTDYAEIEIGETYSVNALHRAYSISTRRSSVEKHRV